MQVGCLGDIIFSVSPRKIETINNLKRSVSANYSEHKRHNSSGILEFTGISPETLSFSLVLSSELGVNIANELKKFEEYTKKGKVLKFILGKQLYGSGKWVITGYTVNHKYFDKRGVPFFAELSVNLKEYCE